MFRKIALIWLLLLSPATAWPVRGSATNNGGSAINIGEGQSLPAFFVDILKVSYIGFAGGATPGDAALDDQGWPTRTFTGLVTRSVSTGATYVTNYTIVWPAGAQFQITNVGQNSNCVLAGVGGTITSGCAGINVTLTVNGSGAGSMSFDTNNFSMQFPGTASWGAANSNIGVSIVRTSDLSNLQNTSDHRKYFTPEFIAEIRGLHPKTIRTMGWTQVSSIGTQISNVVFAADKSKLTDISWVGFRFPMKYWSGGAATSGAITHTASGTCNGSSTAELYTASATTANPSLSGTPAYGTTIMGVIDTANTTTSPLLCAGTTAFPIWNGKTNAAPVAGGGGTSGVGVNSGTAASNGLATFVFEPRLGTGGVWIYYLGGMTSQPPVTAQVLLANGINVDLQVTVPYLAANDYLTAMGTDALILNPWLIFKVAWANEVWNTHFAASSYAQKMGAAFGWTTSGFQDQHSFYALRTIQIANIIGSIWTGRNFQQVLEYQAGASNANNTTFRMGGFNLNTTIGTQKYCEATGGTWSGTCSGGVNYDTAPTRPADIADVLSYAPYAGGANLMFGPDICVSCTPSSLNTSFYQSLVTAWETGDTDTSRALIDSDVRSGRIGLQTVTCSTDTWTTSSPHGYTTATNVAFTVAGGSLYGNLVANAVYRLNTLGSSTFKIQAFVNGEPSGANITCGTAASGTVTVGSIASGANNFQTMQVLNSTWYLSGQYFAGTLYASRPNGKAALRVEQYEANPEIVGPNFTQCNGLGVTSSAPTTNFTATFTNGSKFLTAVTNAANLINGMVISGNAGIAGGQTILSIDPTALTAQLSAVATGSGTTTGLIATDNCSTSISKAEYDYRKNSTQAAKTWTNYQDQFMGRDTAYPTTYGLMNNSKVPSALAMNSGTADSNNAASNTYSLVDGPFPDSAKFKWYDGFASFVGVP